MVFSFTFFTYNGQRLFRLRKKNLPNKIGIRLQWIIKHKTTLAFLSLLFGLIGLICVYFITPFVWIVLIPMGALSFFYVIPIIPFYSNSPTLRQIPFLKIFVIAFVWSIVIVAVPMLSSEYINFELHHLALFLYAILQVFCFVLGITIPFDIRDIKYDKQDGLKTIPSVLGIKPSIFFAELFLLISIGLLYVIFTSSPIFYVLLIGHIITMGMVLYSSDKRKEMFFAGWIEGSVLILYGLILIADYLYFL